MSSRSPALAGDERRRTARHYAQLYRSGATIRGIAEQTGRSYCLVRTLLDEAGVTFRPRGGGLPRH